MGDKTRSDCSASVSVHPSSQVGSSFRMKNLRESVSVHVPSQTDLESTRLEGKLLTVSRTKATSRTREHAPVFTEHIPGILVELSSEGHVLTVSVQRPFHCWRPDPVTANILEPDVARTLPAPRQCENMCSTVLHAEWCLVSIRVRFPTMLRTK